MADQSSRGKYRDVVGTWKVGVVITLSVLAAAMIPVIGPAIKRR